MVICDGEGTLELHNPTRAKNLIAGLAKLNIELAIASNASHLQLQRRFGDVGLNLPSVVVTPAEVYNRKKPKADFVFEVQRRTGVELCEIVFLGDDDNTDTFCAINARVLPFTADYSTATKPRHYGILMANYESFLSYLEHFGKQTPPYFGWVCQDTDRHGRPIDMRALFGDHARINSHLQQVLKNQRDVKVGSSGTSLRDVLFHYLLNQCYQSGLAAEVDYITVYPGHEAGRRNDTLEDFSRQLGKVFRDRFIPDLLVRHTTAPKSQYQGPKRNIMDQLNTIHVNPSHNGKLDGKRVLVLDDFTTYGYSFETARQMLFRAGVSAMTGVAIAKYRQDTSSIDLKSTWDAFSPHNFGQNDLQAASISGTFNTQADNYFYTQIWDHYSR
ncbi:MAG: HAD hydrolase-like protein [Aggregatilineales bacterium]